jgi:ATP-dependent RNA helicase DeaD
VGTPGRILDHLRRGSLKLDALDYCVLDEADEILNMGFLEDVHEILRQTNANKRTLLFSATMPAEILKIAKTYMGPYELVRIQDKQLTVAQTDQIYFQVSEADKFEALCRIIDFEEDFYGLVFCRTKIDADKISHRLVDRGYDVDTLHGDLSQMQREKVMNRFRKHQINILVATDVAARGIDVNDLSHVINFAIPQDPESYVHRIGRTGRAGKNGTAITFITPSEEKKLNFIEQKTNSKIRKERVPQVKDIIQAKKQRIRADLENLTYSDVNREYLLMANELLENNSPELVLAALLKQTYQEELNPANYNEIREVPSQISGQTRLFIAKGRKDGMTPPKLVHFIAVSIKIKPKQITDVLIQEDFSFITVPFKEAEMILKYFRRQKNGKRSIVEKATPRL